MIHGASGSNRNTLKTPLPMPMIQGSLNHSGTLSVENEKVNILREQFFPEVRKFLYRSLVELESFARVENYVF